MTTHPTGRFLLAVVVLSSASCACLDRGDNPERTFCDFATPYADHVKSFGQLVEGDSGSQAKVEWLEGHSSGGTAHPGERFSFLVPFVGGPVDLVRVTFGKECSFEIPIDLSLASSGWHPAGNRDELVAQDLALSGNHADGALAIVGTLTRGLTLPDAKVVEYSAQVRGKDGRLSPPVSGGTITLCTQDDDCTPGGEPGGQGGGMGDGGTDTVLCSRFVVKDEGSNETGGVCGSTYVCNGTGLVTDIETNRTWMRNPFEKYGGTSFGEATTYCAERGMSVPTKEELMGIMAPFCIAAFPNIHVTTVGSWTRSAYDGPYPQPGEKWCVPRGNDPTLCINRPALLCVK